MNIHIRNLALVTAVLALALTAPAAVTVYNNFAPGHNGWDYNWGLGWTVAGVDVPAQYGVEQAMLFYPTHSGLVADIWVAMWYAPPDGGHDEVTLLLTRNPNMEPPRPEDVLEQWVITGFESWTEWRVPKHVRGAGTSYLEQGQSYWLWAVGGRTTWCGWCMNIDPRFTCPHTMRREGENWLPIADETASAFRVDVWLLGDLNCDAAVNFGDINPFVLALSDPNEYRRQFPDCQLLAGDINGDGVVDFGDINPFVELLSGE